ncbi:MAG TPA: hypothetical protein VKJ45_24530 [Blastocatellia bacterium]|nr:hypothetical protein [Blastocatellia bacterium]
MGHLDYPGGSWFNDIAITADGGIIASEFATGDNIVRFTLLRRRVS